MNREKTLPDGIRKCFDDMGVRLFCYSLADSTNKRAREYCIERVPALFIADEQTEGRGRLGRSFFSPCSTGLYMTLLIEAPSSSDSFTRITALAAVALREAISDVLGIDTGIKWVNDLYLGDKKVAGILAESFVKDDRRYVALGMGVNLSTSDFPSEICDIAGSLLTDVPDDEELEALRLGLAFEVSRRLILVLSDRGEEEYMDKYRQYSCVLGKRISFSQNREMKQATAVDITSMGELVAELDLGERQLLSTGEISVRVICEKK